MTSLSNFLSSGTKKGRLSSTYGAELGDKPTLKLRSFFGRHVELFSGIEYAVIGSRMQVDRMAATTVCIIL